MVSFMPLVATPRIGDSDSVTFTAAPEYFTALSSRFVTTVRSSSASPLTIRSPASEAGCASSAIAAPGR